MKGGRFRLLPHTADLLVEARGGDLPELFSSCVLALFSLLVDRRIVRKTGVRTATVEGETPGEQLFLLLREAFLLFASDRFLVRSAHVTMKGRHVTMTATGESFDPARHPLVREIKAVTAHAMAVECSPGGCVARFVLDV